MAKPEIASASLTPIAIGELSSKQARELVQRYVAEHRQSGDALYGAFRAWTWRSLTERRYDSELRSWWELMRMTGALLRQKKQRAYAERFEALCDLLFESIQFGEDEPVDKVLKRIHVRRALQSLSAGWLERPALKSALGLKESNLSRLVSLLQSRGLVERMQRSRIASFRLTRAGQEALLTLPVLQAPASAFVAPATVQKSMIGGGDRGTIFYGTAHRAHAHIMKKRGRKDMKVFVASGPDPLRKGVTFLASPRSVHASEDREHHRPLYKFVLDGDDVDLMLQQISVGYEFSPFDDETRERLVAPLEAKIEKSGPDPNAGYIIVKKKQIHHEPVRKLTHG